MTELQKNLSELKLDGEVRFDEPLSKHTYYRIGGPAEVLIMPRSQNDLDLLAPIIKDQDFYYLGSGSNVLAGDRGFKGIIIKTNRINQQVELISPGRVKVGCSVAVSSFLRNASEKGWGGLEFLTGIPGSMGGVAFMNAGTHLGESKDRLEEVEVVEIQDGQARLKKFVKSELKFSYRKNHFLQSGSLVYSMTWRVDIQEPEEVKKIIQETLQRRKDTQPIDLPSCGSVFKNPRESGLSSWQVIEKIGLRGHQVGKAMFSDKHCNFIVNLGGASSADVRSLIDLAKSRSQEQLDIELEEEVQYLGLF